MTDNLSAGPTIQDLENDNTDNDSEDSTQTSTNYTDKEPESQSDTTASINPIWHCPYCDYTSSDLTNVRNHITESIENDHKGTSGLSATRDLVATNKDGDEVRRIEGSGKRPDEDHHLDHGEKKKLIVNAWLENNQERDIQAFRNIIPVSEQYVQRITKQLTSGEISPEEYRGEMDWDIRRELRKRLEDYYENQENKSMSLTTTDTDELEHGSKKQQIINAWLLDDSVNYTNLDDVLPANKEYIGRIFRRLNDGDIDRSEIEEAADKDFQSELKSALEAEGAEVKGIPTATIDPEVEENTQERIGTNQTKYQATLDEATKKSRILNSVLLARDLDVELTNNEIAGAANSSSQYSQRLTKAITDGQQLADLAEDASPEAIRDALKSIGSSNRELDEDELEDATPEELKEAFQDSIDNVITPNELQEAVDEQLQDALQAYYKDKGVIPASNDETITIDLRHEDDPFKNVSISKKKIIANIYETHPDLTDAQVGELAGASAEHARRTRHAIQDGRYSSDEYEDERVQNELEGLNERELSAFFANEKKEAVEEEVGSSKETNEPESELKTKAESVQNTQDTDTTSIDTSRTSRTPSTPSKKATVSVAEIENIREIADMLYRQAQYEGGDSEHKKAEFIAKELRDRLDGLIETA